ncbi:hypothetical protein HRR83_009544 [Exophiala dermatitidis]|uniref:Stress-associated endoplasmic reticulum protein n=2 Tax=Exophiala dermatitidis TaxID=5970 RepID=H6BLL8_EXODN|nr:uncharacterized protein HMPREF1120_00134 [Exophiala dermatitidis NIH/UT8656]KAJ4518017.1 hypothetical protein HRR74_004312 [Exophiala dermatitidis]EHY51911.1 hypothetical protein HMPREF1120_00134 [Exophiala dermatitidis NIH/UT8656]KAJ4520916.1 hypothetical protein HRR73_003257 [Exophiala dermatitidis]KAJ4547492.1 hypothetical protein HRR76_000130 [Exophiala dermatitidis]KAJ4553246.1 hypothetical protein HRR79_009737 [Exophiala dermatitidis]
MAQTPAQRRANEKHAKTVEKRMGKPETAYKKKETKKSPVGIAAVALLIFVVIAPLLIEQLRLIPAVWTFIMDLLARIGLVSK